MNQRHLPELKISSQYLGYGIDDDGREYEGYDVNGVDRYYYTADGTELKE